MSECYKVVGIDVGRTNDATAIVVMNVESGEMPGAPKLTVGYYETFLGNLHRAAGHVYHLWRSEPLSGQAQLLVDARGLGQGICDILENMNVPLHAVMTTAGEHETSRPSDTSGSRVTYHGVPKKTLVASALVSFQQGRLKFLPGKQAEQLKQELANFVPKQNDRTGHISYEAARAEHDDIVFSLLLCCWGAKVLGSLYQPVDETLSGAATSYYGRTIEDDRADTMRGLGIDTGYHPF